MDNYFVELNKLNLNDVKETRKGGINKETGKQTYLDYISWAWAWGELKKHFPMSYSTIYENKDGWNYHTDGRTAWVKVGVTVEGLEHIEYLPIMNRKNESIPLEAITSMDVNKSIQRALTKAIARHGIGLYVYAGEDLPEDADVSAPVAPPKKPAKPAPAPNIAEPKPLPTVDNIMSENQISEDEPLAPNAMDFPTKEETMNSIQQFKAKEELFKRLQDVAPTVTKEKFATFYKVSTWDEVTVDMLKDMLKRKGVAV